MSQFISNGSSSHTKTAKYLLSFIFILVIAASGTLLFKPSRATGCDLSASPSNFASQVSAASSGQTVCLASGNYGNWSGINKTIIITAAAGASPSMTFSFAAGASGFTLSGMSGMGGSLDSGASNITIENSDFTSPTVITGLTNANITFNNDKFEPEQASSTCTDQPAVMHLSYTIGNGTTPSGVTVENSDFEGGQNNTGNNPRQGINTGESMVIKNNIFNGYWNLSGCNHIDDVQLYGGANVTATGNLFYNGYDGLAAFDGTSSNTITDNACINPIPNINARGDCITLYADTNSIVNHNTAIGQNVIELDHKSGNPAGTGTIVENNIGSESVSNGSTMAINTNNLFSGASSPNLNGNPTFSGGSSPTTWSGFELTSTSVGHNAATDGTDVGIRASAGGPGSTGSPPPPSYPVPTISLTAVPTSITSGKTSTVSWSVTNSSSSSPTGCNASGGWSGSKATNGSLAVSPAVNTTYSLTCSGPGGTSSPASISITVTSSSGGQGGQSGGGSSGSSSGNTSGSSNNSGGGSSTPPRTVDLNNPASVPVSGVVNLNPGVAGATKVSYMVDGKPYGSPILNTSQLADGTHTVTTTFTAPNGHITIEKTKLQVNNHHPFLKNLELRYGNAAVISGISFVSLLIVAIIIFAIWYLIIKPRPRLQQEIEEHLPGHHNEKPTTKNINLPQETNTHSPSPGTIFSPHEDNHKPKD